MGLRFSCIEKGMPLIAIVKLVAGCPMVTMNSGIQAKERCANQPTGCPYPNPREKRSKMRKSVEEIFLIGLGIIILVSLSACVSILVVLVAKGIWGLIGDFS